MEQLIIDNVLSEANIKKANNDEERYKKLLKNKMKEFSEEHPGFRDSISSEIFSMIRYMKNENYKIDKKTLDEVEYFIPREQRHEYSDMVKK